MSIAVVPSILERSARAGTWTFDIATGEIFWSPGALSLHGLPADAPMPAFDEIFASYSADSQAAMREALSAAVGTGAGASLELEQVFPDGTRRFVDVVIEVGLKDGRPAQIFGVVVDIDHRKRAELRVVESERRLREMFMSSVQFMGLLGADGVVLEVNDSSVAFGSQPDAMPIGKAIWDTWWWSHSGDVQSQVHEAVERAAAGEFVRFEAEVRAEPGQFATIDFSLKPVLDPDGRIRVLIAEGRDISERRKAEQAVRRNEERFRLMFENAPIGMALVDLKGRWTTVNRTLCEIVGYSRLEMLAGLTFQKLTHPDDLCEHEANVTRLGNGEVDQYRLENRFLHKNGTPMHVQADVSLLRDENGAPQCYIAQIQDIGPRRRFEDALFAEKELAQVTLASIGDGVIRTDADGLISFCNAAAAKVLGEPVHRLLGCTFRSSVRLHAARTGLRVACPVAQTLRTGRASAVPPGTTLDTPRGHIAVEDSMSPIRGLDGRLLGAVFVFRERQALQRRTPAPPPEAVAPIPTGADGRPDWARLVREAMDQDRIELFAQRIVPLNAGSPPSYEVLMRLRGEDQGLVSPMQFLPAAQHAGLAGELDLHVVRQALIQVAHLERASPDRFSYVTINLSGSSLADPAFATAVIDELQRRRIGRGRIRFEITEAAAVADLASAQTFVARLREAGCKVMVDHFGTGNAPPDYIHWLGADGVKFDRARLAGVLDDDARRAQVTRLGDIARALGLDILAEGVEDSQLAELLGGMGVGHAQGYYYHVAEPIQAAFA